MHARAHSYAEYTQAAVLDKMLAACPSSLAPWPHL